MCEIATIITPVYNGEKYLKRYFKAIKSIPTQNIQVIVINDGSNDLSWELMTNAAKEDNRIQLINKTRNEGISSARNDALLIANGEWVFFFDCDDTFEPNIVEYCVKRANDNKADAVCYNYASVRKDGKCIPHIFSYKKRIYTRVNIIELLNHSYGTSIDEMFSYLCNKRTIREDKELNGPWRMMYSLKKIQKENIRFKNELKVGEDTIFTNEYLSLCERIYTDNKVLYYLHENEGSTINTYQKDVNSMITGKLKLINAKIELSKKIHDKCGLNVDDLWGGEYILSSVQIGLIVTDLRINFWEKCRILKSYHCKKQVKEIWGKVSILKLLKCSSVKAVPLILLKLKLVSLTELLMILFQKSGKRISGAM